MRPKISFTTRSGDRVEPKVTFLDEWKPGEKARVEIHYLVHGANDSKPHRLKYGEVPDAHVQLTFEFYRDSQKFDSLVLKEIEPNC